MAEGCASALVGSGGKFLSSTVDFVSKRTEIFWSNSKGTVNQMQGFGDGYSKDCSKVILQD